MTRFPPPPARTLLPRRLLAVVALCCVSGLTQVFAQAVPNDYVTQQSDLPCVEKRFSLVVHVVDAPEGPQDFDRAAFEAMVALANTWFAPICVSFEACEYETVANYRYASLENRDADELRAQYGNRNVIDVYVPATDSTRVGECSLASTDSLSEAADRAFVTVLGECVDSTSKALAHELGHFFGLLHTFAGEGDELVDGSNCETAGDRVCDTPADPFTVGREDDYVSADDPCRFVFRGTDANGAYYVPHTANVMSYYADRCACGFTHDQLLRMVGEVERAAGRLW